MISEEARSCDLRPLSRSSSSPPIECIPAASNGYSESVYLRDHVAQGGRAEKIEDCQAKQGNAGVCGMSVGNKPKQKNTMIMEHVKV